MKLIITLNLPDQFDYSSPPQKIRDDLTNWVAAHTKGGIVSALPVQLRGDLHLRKAYRAAVRHGDEHVAEVEFDGVLLTS